MDDKGLDDAQPGQTGAESSAAGVGIGPPFATITDTAGTRIVGGRIGAAPALTVPEWQAQAARLFGDDPLKWRFKCPICGHVQTPEDFRQFKDRGATPQTATQECIGRYLPKPYRPFSDEPAPKRSPCDYAAFGLFRIGTELTHEDGKKVTVFPFDEPAALDSERSGTVEHATKPKGA